MACDTGGNKIAHRPASCQSLFHGWFQLSRKRDTPQKEYLPFVFGFLFFAFLTVFAQLEDVVFAAAQVIKNSLVGLAGCAAPHRRIPIRKTDRDGRGPMLMMLF